jgi:hypothetical protein
MAKRIMVATFRHPSVKNGMVHFEDEHYKVDKNGLVELPIELGQNAEWDQVDDGELRPVEDVLQAAGDDKKDPSKGGKKDPPAGDEKK